MKMVRSKVAGVSFRNDDGSSRQRIIRKYCRAGKSLEVRLEPDNRYSDDAMGLWVRGRWLFIFPARYQVGHIRNEIATQIRQDVVRGCPISVRILDVTGGGWFHKQYYGVNIEIRVGRDIDVSSARPPERRSAQTPRPPSGAIPSPSPAKPSFWTSLKSIAAARLSSAARVLVRIARDLAARFRALTRYQKIIASGFLACCIGLAVWAVGLFAAETLGWFSVLRPTGVVTIIVGLGIVCLGTVFHFAEPTRRL